MFKGERMDEIADEDIDKFVTEELEKDVTQEETIDEEDLKNKMGEMGFLWSAVLDKFQKDKFCFVCKQEKDFSKEKLQVLEGTSEKGTVAFVSVCEKCKTKIEKEQVKKSGR